MPWEIHKRTFVGSRSTKDETWKAESSVLSRRIGLDGGFVVMSVAGAFRVSAADFAIALLGEAEPPKHGRTRFTVAY